MNFDSPLGENLVMEAIWSTPTRGWQRDMSKWEVSPVNTHGNFEHTLYFCIEEFETTGKRFLLHLKDKHIDSIRPSRIGKVPHSSRIPQVSRSWTTTRHGVRADWTKREPLRYTVNELSGFLGVSDRFYGPERLGRRTAT